jgi:hypothetical protein
LLHSLLFNNILKIAEKTIVTNPVTQKKMMIVIKKGVTVAVTQRKLRIQFQKREITRMNQNQSSLNKKIWP